MGYFVFRKWYFAQAKNKWQAYELLRKAEEEKLDKDYFEGEWAKEEPHGWMSSLKRQLGGK